MYRNLFISAFFCICFFQLKAQNFQGFNSSRYAGVHSVYLNPANIYGSKYRWDVNLFSVHATVQNSNATLSIDDFKNGFDTDKLIDEIAADGTGLIDALVNTEILGPSAMFRVGKKSAFAITTRARSLTVLNDIDGNLLKQLSDDQLTYPINVNVNALQQLAATGWAEAGITYSRHLLTSGKWDLHGGLTVKAVGGALSGYVYSDQLSAVFNEEPNNSEIYATNSRGRIGFGFSGQGLEDVEVADLVDFKNLTPGFDIGFNFMLREEGMQDLSRNPADAYKWKFGLSVLDIGSMKFDLDANRSGAYNINIGSAEKFYLDAFDNIEIDDINTVFQSYPQYFTPVPTPGIGASYNVSLPTRLMADVDYHFKNNWYVNITGQVSLVSGSVEKPYNTAYYSGITLTPRYDARHFGFWVPLHYNPVTSFNAGFGFRAGPLIVGSGSVLSTLFGQSKQADGFIGFRFGGLPPKNNKTARTTPEG